MTALQNATGALDARGGGGGIDLGRSSHIPYIRSDAGLQPVGSAVDRVINRLSRQFAISRAHAKVAAELSGLGAQQ